MKNAALFTIKMMYTPCNTTKEQDNKYCRTQFFRRSMKDCYSFTSCFMPKIL